MFTRNDESYQPRVWIAAAALLTLSACERTPDIKFAPYGEGYQTKTDLATVEEKDLIALLRSISDERRSAISPK